METPKEYYYTYYSYEEWGRGYFGSRKCYCLPEEDIKYFGSFKDKTFKPTQKIILKSDYATREEAYADEIILQKYYKVVENPHFANRSYQSSTKFYVPKEQSIENGKRNGPKAREKGVGIFAQTPEQKSENCRKGGLKVKETGIGIFAFTPEQRSEHSSKMGLKTREKGTGIFSLTTEQKSQLGRRNGLKAKQNGTGIFSLSKEQMSENGRKNAAQRWECCETGYVSTAAGVVNYQKGKRIDTSKNNRKRIS